MPVLKVSPQPPEGAVEAMNRSAEDIHAGRVSDVRDTQARVRAKIEAYEREHAPGSRRGMG
jgi:hypothetical protein